MAGQYQRRLVLTLWVLVLAGQLLLAGCAARRPHPDPQRGARLYREAETLYAQRHYQQAATKLAQALPLLPDNSNLILRYGELLELLDKPAQAAGLYREKHPLVVQRRSELIYHLARLELFVFGHIQDARKLLAQIPVWDWRHTDIRAGLMLLADNNPRDALREFLGLARRLNKSTDSAWPYYHAALALKRLGDSQGMTRALLNAISRSRHKGLDRRIEIFWNQNKSAPLPDRPS